VQRVLVVDDEELYRVYLRRFLEPLGYEVETADNGVEAIERARRFAPHLLIVDWRLDDGMDGLEVIQRLQA
jgi:CheY-like chemotaxis protein